MLMPLSQGAHFVHPATQQGLEVNSLLPFPKKTICGRKTLDKERGNDFVFQYETQLSKVISEIVVELHIIHIVGCTLIRVMK